MSVERLIDSAERLGECPLWDERSQALWWVDILDANRSALLL